jgi:SAM-dependent MidA family methyltransferase
VYFYSFICNVAVIEKVDLLHMGKGKGSLARNMLGGIRLI